MRRLLSGVAVIAVIGLLLELNEPALSYDLDQARHPIAAAACSMSDDCSGDAELSEFVEAKVDLDNMADYLDAAVMWFELSLSAVGELYAYAEDVAWRLISEEPPASLAGWRSKGRPVPPVDIVKFPDGVRRIPRPPRIPRL